MVDSGIGIACFEFDGCTDDLSGLQLQRCAR